MVLDRYTYVSYSECCFGKMETVAWDRTDWEGEFKKIFLERDLDLPSGKLHDTIILIEYGINIQLGWKGTQ